MNNQSLVTKMKAGPILFMLLLLSLGLTGCGCEVIDTGHRGIKTNFGKVVGDPLGEGLQWYNPITENIIELSVREEKFEDKQECFTRDTQKVIVRYAMNYYPRADKIGILYQELGYTWDEKLVKPQVLQALKDTIGQYVADDLVHKREEARDKTMSKLKAILATRDVTVVTLALTNLDFDDAYEKAVEEKVVAIQRAEEAKNKSRQVEEEAKQTIKRAEAEAESMRIRTQALSLNKGLVEYEMVQKWDGKYPQYLWIGGNDASTIFSMPIKGTNETSK